MRLGSGKFDSFGKLTTELRDLKRSGSFRAKETHDAGFGANPELLRPGIKVKHFLFVDLGCRVLRRKHFDANLRRSRKADAIPKLAKAGCRGPRDIGGFDAVRCRDWALSQDTSGGQKLL